MFDFDFKIPKDRKSLIYFAVAGGTLLLLLISFVYTSVGGGQKPPAISPVNPLTSTSESRSSKATSSNSTADSSQTASSGKPTTSSTSKQATTKSTTQSSGPAGQKNVIIQAVLDKSDSNNGESINTFTVNKAIEEKGLETIVTDVTVAKYTAENMEAMGHKDKQGFIDIALHLENKGTEPVTIKPEDIKFTVNGKEYPLDPSATLKNTTIEKGQKVEDSTLTFVMPELDKADAVKEISFNWQSATGSKTQDYNVLLVLKK